MTVKVSPPIDITSSFNSSIPEPDVGLGEEVWQDEDQRIFQSANITTDSLFVDAIYVDEGSGPTGGSGLFILTGNLQIGYKVRQYNQSGGVIRTLTVPTPQPSIGSHQAISLSLVRGNVLYVSRAKYSSSIEPDDYQWSFDYVMYSLINFNSIVADAQVSNKFSNYPDDSYFRIKTNGSETAVIAIDPFGSSGLYVFNSSSQELGSTSKIYKDIAITESEVYALANAPISVAGGFVTRVGVLGFDLSSRIVVDFDRITGSWVSPIINYGINQITHGVEHTFSRVYARVYDKNMINIGSYKRNDEVIKLVTHKKYRCAVDATFDDPELGVNLSPPTWVEIGATNKWAIMDSSTSQRSIFNGGGNVSCSVTSPVDAVGIFGMINVNSVTLTIKQGATTLYTETKSAIDPLFSDTNIKDMVFFTPPFENVQVIVNFTGSNCQAGRFAVGRTSDIGRAVTGTELGDIDYSTIEYDNFGRTVYRERPIVPYHNLQIDVAKSKSISISRKIQSLRGLDVMWIADIGLDEPLIAIGRCERSPITYTNPSLVSYSLKIRGTA